MRTLIEKQAAAAAARQNSPSRLEAFAADSPTRQRSTAKSTLGSGDGPSLGSSRGGGGWGAVSPPHHEKSAGGVSLAELVAATTPPRSRGGIDTRIGCSFKGGGVHVDGGDAREAQRSMARETYTKTFSGMQV